MPGNVHVITLADTATWPPPNYVDPVRRTWMPVYAGIFQAITTLMVATRLWLRINKQAGALGLDDALLIPGYLFLTMFTGLAILSATNYESDRHVWDVQPVMYPKIMLVAWLSEVSFIITTCCTKVSVLLFYRRLTTGTYSKRWKWATIAAIIFTFCFGLALILVLIFNCDPTDAYWNSLSPTYVRTYHCSNTTALNPVSGALSVLSDLYAVVLPMGMMRHFETDRRKKIALNCVFSLGLLVVVAGAVRTYYLNLLGTGMDLTWIGFDLFVWSLLEAHLALICASAPALRVFFRMYLSDPISRVMHSHKSQSGIRSMNYESSEAICRSYTHERDASDCNKDLVKNAAKPSLAVVGEDDVESQTSSPTGPVGKTADFEGYVLQNLEKHQTRFGTNHESDTTFTLSGPLSDENGLQRSWLDG